MAKRLYDTMLAQFTAILIRLKYDLIEVEFKEQQVKDADGNPTGEMQKYSDYEVEIPKGNGPVSRKQLSIKVIEEPSTVLDEEKLSEGAYTITFSGLTITYLDPQRHAIYLRATGYEIIDEETGKVVSRRE